MTSTITFMTTSSLLLCHFLMNKDRKTSMVSFWRSFTELSNGHGFCYVFLIGWIRIFKNLLFRFFLCYGYVIERNWDEVTERSWENMINKSWDNIIEKTQDIVIDQTRHWQDFGWRYEQYLNNIIDKFKNVIERIGITSLKRFGTILLR